MEEMNRLENQKSVGKYYWLRLKLLEDHHLPPRRVWAPELIRYTESLCRKIPELKELVKELKRNRKS